MHEDPNILQVSADKHRGRHTNKYHTRVYNDVVKANNRATARGKKLCLSNKEIRELRRKEVLKTLDGWRDRVTKNPGIMYEK